MSLQTSKVIGKATGMSGVDTSWTQSDSKGFQPSTTRYSGSYKTR